MEAHNSNASDAESESTQVNRPSTSTSRHELVATTQLQANTGNIMSSISPPQAPGVYTGGPLQPFPNPQRFYSPGVSRQQSRQQSVPRQMRPMSQPPQSFRTSQPPKRPFQQDKDDEEISDDQSEPRPFTGRQPRGGPRNQVVVSNRVAKRKKTPKTAPQRLIAHHGSPSVASASFDDTEEESLMVEDDESYHAPEAHMEEMGGAGIGEDPLATQQLPLAPFTSEAYENLYENNGAEGFGQFTANTFPNYPGLERFEGPGDLREPVAAGGNDAHRSQRDLQNVPVMVEQNEVTDAYLKKRGIERPANGKKVCKRGAGASDPENIRIVNLREFGDMNFEQIKNVLNKERIERGQDPKLTTTGVANRYGRTAPLLFAGQNIPFIPLHQRRGKNMAEAIRMPKVNWTPDRDMMLVNAVEKWESTKWDEVARIFNEESGCNADKATVSNRYVMI
ncbi:hypothetical protein HYALB_00005911 [Hymenoscyphus albidus]|uniref:Myb-like domain-containing protein n=1 Tax=Hymenoscyphus albidus TaxID=595503 RepID=A0A9N9LSG0_9HELO|nr:hypothetical protein HYALB_00005911 [Hymenoscyphus albidus]